MFAAIIIVLILALVGYFIYNKYSSDFKRARILKKYRVYQQSWSETLSESFVLFDDLSQEQRETLLDKITIFLGEKTKDEADFSCERSLLAAAHACLPIIKRKSNFYPLLDKDYKELDPIEWFYMHEKQFEFEFGKMSLRLFNGEFPKKSMEFFYTPDYLSNDQLRALKAYYGLDPLLKSS